MYVCKYIMHACEEWSPSNNNNYYKCFISYYYDHGLNNCRQAIISSIISMLYTRIYQTIIFICNHNNNNYYSLYSCLVPSCCPLMWYQKPSTGWNT